MGCYNEICIEEVTLSKPGKKKKNKNDVTEVVKMPKGGKSMQQRVTINLYLSEEQAKRLDSMKYPKERIIYDLLKKYVFEVE